MNETSKMPTKSADEQPLSAVTIAGVIVGMLMIVGVVYSIVAIGFLLGVIVLVVSIPLVGIWVIWAWLRRPTHSNKTGLMDKEKP